MPARRLRCHRRWLMSGYSGSSASCTSGHPKIGSAGLRTCTTSSVIPPRCWSRGGADLHNLVCDPATLLVAWRRVRGNRGSRSAGIDGQTAYEIEHRQGVQRFLGELREELRAGTLRPVAVKERAIPKRG